MIISYLGLKEQSQQDQCHINCILQWSRKIPSILVGQQFVLLVLLKHVKLLQITLLATEVVD